MTVKLDVKFVKTRSADRNLTMRDLAAAADVGEATMYRIINGAGFNLETLGKLALALECNPVDLIKAEGFPAPLVGAQAA